MLPYERGLRGGSWTVDQGKEVRYVDKGGDGQCARISYTARDINSNLIMYLLYVYIRQTKKKTKSMTINFFEKKIFCSNFLLINASC